MLTLSLFFFSLQAQSATVTVSSNTSWAAGTSSGDDVIVSGATLTLAAGSYSFNSLTIQSSGVVLLSSSAGTGVTITTVGNVTIDGTSSINGDGRGYTTGGTGAGGAGASVNNGGGGGGHGTTGSGGATLSTGGNAYGSATQPVTVGSNGGTSYGGSAGGAGGGAIKLVVGGTLSLAGNITVNGNNGTNNVSGTGGGGGGSGGSIWLQVGTLSGAGGLQAKGGNGGSGNGGWTGGNGAGGRIAVYYTSSTYTGTASVATGTGYSVSPTYGTYFEQNSSTGDFNCSNPVSAYYEATATLAYALNNFNVSGNCLLSVKGANTNSISIPGNLTVASGSTLTGGTTGTLSATNKSTQPISGASTGGVKLIVTGTTQIDGTLSALGIWLQTGTLAGAGTITQGTSGSIALYYSTANTFSGTVTMASGTFFLQNYSTGDVSCPFNITANFNPADSLPGYSTAIRNVSITNGCKYGFAALATGTSATLTITGDMTIDATPSYFYGDAKGFTTGGTGQGTAGTASQYGGGGGGYGGAGGTGATIITGGSAYGSATQPVSLGSNGGSGYNAATGGTGGGAIKLVVAGTLTVNGQITANGSAGANYGSGTGGAGGGSGGSIWIQAGTLAGNGTIQAKGGNGGTGTGGWNGGGGGGGRIALYYTTNTFSGSVLVSSGTGYVAGTSGTYFSQDSSGNVLCSSATTTYYDPSSPPTTAIHDLTISNGCTFIVQNGTSMPITGNLTIGSGSTMTVPTGTALSSTNKTTQPTTTSGVAALQLVVTGTSQIDGTLSGTAVWLKTGSLAGAGTISQNTNGAIALYYSTANTFSGTVTINGGSYILQNYSTGDLFCPHAITTFFNPADSLPSYSAAINNVSITNGCKYGFASLATGTSATLTAAGDMTIDATSYFYQDAKGFTTGGTGAGTAGSIGSYGGGGGGYGGAGALGTASSAGGSTYGSATQPVSLGSNGGTGYSVAAGGAGGGAAKLVVAGTLTVSGQITANGAVGANYGAGTGGAGGGSGGSIWIQAGTLAGNGSILAKGGNGGTGASSWNGGGGGGGRIAIYYTTKTFSGTVSVAGGTGNATGTSGTYFTQDASGNLVCNSATTTYYDPSSPPTTPINDLTISNGCTFILQNGSLMTVTGNLTIGSGSSMTTPTGTSVSATNKTTQPTTTSGVGAMQVAVAGTSQVDGTLSGTAVWLKTGTLAGAGTISQNSSGAIALYYSTANTFSGTVTINSGSFFLQNYSTGDVSCPYNITSYFNPSDSLPSYSAAIRDFSLTNGCRYGFASQATGTAATLTITGNMTIDGTPSYFSADAKGYTAGGTGAGSAGSIGNYGGGGGSYGGVGGVGVSSTAPGATYGSATQPVSLGSNGGTGYSVATGGAGGGAIKLVVAGTVTVNGQITANGGTGANFGSGTGGGGGGSGGSIWIQANTLAGTGTIQAKGGNGGTGTSAWNGGAGGGGRIALYFTTKTFSGTVSVAVGTGNGSPGVGTIAGLNPATKLVFSTQPSSTGQVGVNLAQQPVVQAQDGSNSIDVNYSTNVTLTAYTDNTCTTTVFAGATVAGSPLAATNGISSFSGVYINKYNNGNPIYLKATSGSLTSTCSTAVTLSVGPASVLVFTTQPSVSNTAGVVFSTVPVVAAQDGYNDTVTTYATAITLSVYSDNTCTTSVTGGTLTAGSVTPTSGVSTFTGIKYTKAGTGFYFKASSGSLTTGCSSAFDIAAGSLSSIVFSTQPSGTGTAGVDLAQQPVVTFQDTYGNTTTTTGGVLSLSASTASDCSTAATGGTLSGSSAVSAAGVAPFSNVSYTKSGTFYFKASYGAITWACSTAIVIGAGPAAKVAFTTQPSSSAKPGVNFTTQPVATIQDSYGNTVTSSSAGVSLAAYTDATCATPAPGNLLFLGSTTNGVHPFTSTSYDQTGKIYLQATSGALTPACSSVINLSNVVMFFRGF